jgi:hypothetical protein
MNKMIYYARNDMYKGSKKIICVYLLLLAFIPGVVLAETSDDWEFGLSIYGWFPDIGGQDWPVDVTAAVNFDMKSLIWTNAAYLMNRRPHSIYWAAYVMRVSNSPWTGASVVISDNCLCRVVKAALWRYMDYNLPDDGPIADMNFSGPEIGAVFRW